LLFYLLVHPSQSVVILWTVRAACVLYVFALALWLARKPRLAPLLWTLGFACYLGHVLSAFAFHYEWSHRAAYVETARQAAALFRIQWGGGIYFNYLFTVVWAADVFWMWLNRISYRNRPRWIRATVHAFLAFMFFNGAVVFASGWVRWFGLGSIAGLIVLRIRRGLTSYPETGQTIPL
jgi:hypothetical protein